MQDSKQRLNGVREFFDSIASTREVWKKKNWYYHKKVEDYHRALLGEGLAVLEIGSGDGDLLASLKPSRGLGIDSSASFVKMARDKHPGLEFRQGFAENLTLNPGETFDAIVLCNAVGYLEDIEMVFENLHKACTPSTRIIIHYYNYLWEPMLWLGMKLGLRMKQPPENWLSSKDLENLLHLAGFETVKSLKKMIFPLYIPLISNFLNKYVANLPLINSLCLSQIVIARPKARESVFSPTVSVVVACKNEKGNIPELVERLSRFPADCETIFVDGMSTDGTKEEIQRIQSLHPDQNIRVFDQTEKTGKGGAVRIGFAEAKGDILIILDADLSVAPEDMIKFYDLLKNGTGEFINGSRMVYPMEKQAMRFLNILGNKFFSSAFTYLLGQGIRDTLCGTKALRRVDYEKIAANRAFFGEFDPFGDFDLLFGADKLNLKIIEIPVRYYERKYGTTKIHRFRHGFLLLGMCVVAWNKLKCL